MYDCQSGVWQPVGEGLGYNQTWINVSWARNSGLVYVNGTNKPIYISINITVSNTVTQLYVAGQAVGSTAMVIPWGWTQVQLSAIVPSGETYQIIGAFDSWYELR